MAARSYAKSTLKLLLVALAFLLAAAIGGVIWLKTLDTEVYRRTLERELSGLLGRTVSVDAVAFELSLRPALSVRGLRIANPPWASRPDFVSVSSGEARVDLPALWKGRLAIDAVRLDDVDLLLERNADGTGNWTLGAPQRSDKPVSMPDFQTVALARVRLGWRQHDGAVLAADIDSAKATIVDAMPFELEAQGRFRDTPIGLQAKADRSLQAALRQQPLRLAIKLTQQDAALALDLRLPSIDSADGIELGLDASGQHLASWAGIAGLALPDWGPYSLSAQARFGQGKLDVYAFKASLDGLPTHPPHLEIDSGKLLLGRAADTQLSAQGRIGEAALSLQAGTAASQPAAEAGSATPFELNAVLAGLALSAEGRIAADDAAPDLSVRAHGDAMGALRTITGVERDQGLPLDIAAQLVRTRNGYAAQAIRGKLIGVPVSGHLDYQREPRTSLSGALELGMLNLEHPALKALGSKPDGAGSAAGTPPAWLDRIESELSLRVAGLAGLPFPARDLSAQLRWRDQTLQIPALAATLAGTPITGDGTLRWRDGRMQVSGKLNVPLLDLGKLGTANRGGTGPRGRRSPIDQPLPLAPLRALDADLRLDIARIAGAPAAIQNIAAQARLQSGRAGIDVASATIAGVPLKGSVKLDASGAGWRLDANAAADRIDLGSLLRTRNQPDTLSGTILGTQAALGTRGNSARELLANARLSIRSGPFSLALPRDGLAFTVDRASVDVEPGAPLRLSADGKAFGAPVALTMSGGTLAELAEPATAWPKIAASLRSTLDGQQLQVDASTGPLQRLASLHDVPLTLRATAPGASATLEGTVRDLAAPAATPLTTRIELANLAQTAKLFTPLRLPALRVQASGRVALGDGQIAIDGLAAQVGNSDAAGKLQIGWRDQPRLVANLSSKTLDLRQWEQEPAPGQQPLLDRPIPARELLAQDLQLQLRAQRLLLHDYDLAQIQLDGTLQRGLLQLSAQAAEGNLHGEMRFDVRQTPGLALRLQLNEVDSRTLYTEASMPRGGAAPLISMRAQLAANGTTLRRMLETADGGFLITAGPGRLPVQAGYGFERLAGNLLLTLLPGRPADEFNQLVCAAAHFDVAKGVATSSDGIVLRLQRMDILGSGAVNLGSGQILFGYRAVHRNFFSVSLLGLTSGVARVTGTLSEPKVELDPSGVLLTGGAAWATAGVSLLAGELWRKFEATGDPCSRIADGARIPDGPLETLLSAQSR